jgi:ABC-2 type transport system permease protein
VTGALQAEWTKLRTIPSTLWTLLIAVVTALGGSVILAFASASDPQNQAPFDPVTGTFIAWGEYPVLAIGVLGALAVTSEYAAGQIRTTFTAVPRRVQVLGAKAVAVGALVLVVSELLAWIAIGATEIVLAIHHRVVSLGDPGVIRAVLMAGVAMTAVALLAVGVGAVVRHTVAAVTAFPAIVFLPLILLSLPWSWGDSIGRFGLLAAAYQLVSPGRHAGLLPVWTAAPVLLSWPALALVGGAILFQRRDT